MNATKTILDWKNVVWLSLVSYALYTTLWLVIDDEIWHAPGQFSVTEMAVDFCMCVLFVGFSLLYSRTILRILPMRNRPYVRIADGSIPPACLQLLVENAIKHNRHSAEEPLHIDIRREGNHISVCNPVAPLFSAAEPSTGIGQKNIAERYALLSDRQMIVSFTRDTYAVKLPILEN